MASLHRGIGSALWGASGDRMTPVGYGEWRPRSPAGRFGGDRVDVSSAYFWSLGFRLAGASILRR